YFPGAAPSAPSVFRVYLPSASVFPVAFFPSFASGWNVTVAPSRGLPSKVTVPETFAGAASGSARRSAERASATKVTNARGATRANMVFSFLGEVGHTDDQGNGGRKQPFRGPNTAKREPGGESVTGSRG